MLVMQGALGERCLRSLNLAPSLPLPRTSLAALAQHRRGQREEAARTDPVLAHEELRRVRIAVVARSPAPTAPAAARTAAARRAPDAEPARAHACTWAGAGGRGGAG